MKTAGNIFIILYRAISIFLVAAATAVLLLLLLGIRPYAVSTGSMEPTIPTGAVCFVNQRAAFSELAARDVIVFRLGDLLVTHRAVRIDASGVTTKGDANNTEDLSGKVTAENFVGKVVFWIPLVGKLLLYARSLRGKIILFGLLLLFLGAGLFYDKLTNQKDRAASRRVS